MAFSVPFGESVPPSSRSGFASMCSSSFSALPSLWPADFYGDFFQKKDEILEAIKFSYSLPVDSDVRKGRNDLF